MEHASTDQGRIPGTALDPELLGHRAGLPGLVPYDKRVPNPARIYDFLLGGKDHTLVDRAAGLRLMELVPDMREQVRQNRYFLGRVVRWLAGEMGIGQFLDLGSGLPSRDNVHEVARRVVPDARVVYLDNDSLVVTHGNAMLARHEGVRMVGGDIRDPVSILGHADVRGLLDFSRPVAVLMIAVLHFVPDSDDPAGIVGAFRDAVPAGSVLALTHACADKMSPDALQQSLAVYAKASARVVPRSATRIAGLMDGWDLVDPVGEVSGWRPEFAGADDLSAVGSTSGAEFLAAVGVKR
jgi:S-adenosyl methyltransferase